MTPAFVPFALKLQLMVHVPPNAVERRELGYRGRSGGSDMAPKKTASKTKKTTKRAPAGAPRTTKAKKTAKKPAAKKSD